MNTAGQAKRNTSRWRLMLGKGALVVLSLTFILLVLEGALHLTLYVRGLDIRAYQPSFIYGGVWEGPETDRKRFSSHPFLPYIPRSFDTRKMFPYRKDINQVVEIDYTNNSLGFRTPERPFEKPPHTKRIVTLGGSTTFDGPTNYQTWPALLESKLNDTYAQSGYKIEVINLGVDMFASPSSLIVLEFIGLQYQPDLVISYDGVNDSIMLVGAQGMLLDYRNAMSKYDDNFRTLQSRLPKWAFRSYLVTWASFQYDTLFKGDPGAGGQIYAPLSKLKRSSDPIEGVQYFERNLRLMRGASTEYGANFMAATAHWVQPSESVLELNRELRKFFQKERMDYLDLELLLPHNDWSIHVDPVHWTLKGLNQVAEEWKAKIIMKDSLRFENPTGRKSAGRHNDLTANRRGSPARWRKQFAQEISGIPARIP